MNTYNLKENLKLTTALALSKTLQSEDLKKDLEVSYTLFKNLYNEEDLEISIHNVLSEERARCLIILLEVLNDFYIHLCTRYKKYFEWFLRLAKSLATDEDYKCTKTARDVIYYLSKAKDDMWLKIQSVITEYNAGE